jgi:LacI family transcriptional regulator
MTSHERQKNVLLALGRYNPKLHQGVARFAGQHNWHLNAEMAYFGRLPTGWKGDGIVTLLDVQQDLIDFIKKARVPVVDLSVIREDVAVPRVAGDHHLIGCLGAEHFLERGFRHFAWFATLDDAVTRLRLRGFSETLAQSGFTCETWIFPMQTGARCDEWTAKCDFLEHRLRAIPKPAGVFAFRDADAANVLDACDDAGLEVPEEIAILGADNNELICETLRVPLSSVNHDLEGLGYEGAALLQGLMQGQRAPRRPKLVPPKGITVRRSTEVLAINHEPTRRGLQFLQENYRRPTGAEDAARASGLTRRKLERAFREHLGRSIRDQLTALRIRRAKELLMRTSLPVADVAAQTGFNTPQYFNNVFRRSCGLTPRRFRLQYGVGSLFKPLDARPRYSGS